MLALDWGKQIHARIIAEEVEFDSALGSSLVNLYGKCGDLDSASHALNAMDDPDDFSLSALISGYSNCGRIDEARRIFQIRSNPCAVLWNSIIAGYVTNRQGIEALVLFVSAKVNTDSYFGAFFITAMATEGDSYGETRGWVGCGALPVDGLFNLVRAGMSLEVPKKGAFVCPTSA
ncbi:hypothetical protein RJ639_011547 [Escallonia herrerae]|uniref:Pentatricopeptide repeat-containing protein n=1 Tax=Escallonia herrerae TaxID=1293975 RepID=A0AA88VMZ2_9ASTE|nr:hypothetical protein RJ639_011547 [Escallonia herrerae]